MKRLILLASLSIFLLFACGEKQQPGNIGQEHISSYKTIVGESNVAEVKVGILVSSVDLSYIENERAEVFIKCTIGNYSNIPLHIGVGNKYILDSKERLYGISEGSPTILNPSLEAGLDYLFTIPKSILKDSLYFSFIDYKDPLNPSKGFKPKWKIKLKNPSNTPPEEGEKYTLIW